MIRRSAGVRVCLTAILTAAVTLGAGPGGGLRTITSDDLKEWLSYIASDELEGRALFTSGSGLAAGYIESRVRAWGARPAGDRGSYLQTVRILGVRAASRSSLTVEVDGQTRTFADGEGVTFPRLVGGKRRVAIDRVEFGGYGLDVPRAQHSDFAGKDVAGAAVVWLGSSPRSVDGSTYRVLLNARDRYAIDQLHASATIGPDTRRGGRGRAAAREATGAGGSNAPDEPAPQEGAAPDSPLRGRGDRIPAPDFTTVRRLDLAVPPSITAADAFFEFLFSRAPMPYGELKRRAAAQEPLPTFRLDRVRLTFDLDADYEVVRTQTAHNVVAMIEGADPKLRDTFVVFGAHYDHVGYAEGEVVSDSSGTRRVGAPGLVRPGTESDRVWNGADDDGSGTVAVMALAKAFAEGPRPRRSLLFVWHTGEERGLYGSRYFVDHPTVPLGNVMAQLNIDMIGRNRDDRTSEADTVYLVGSDRISSELHAISRAANDTLPRPLTLSYELNDPSDPEQLYFRSDHYSYASKGIPIIFFTTGLHPDYHTNADEVSKIEFDKMTRIVQLIYETGWRLANLDHVVARDNKGARATGAR